MRPNQLSICFVLALASGCSGESAVDDTLFAGVESASLGAAGNQARCSTCHAADGTPAGNSGGSLQDIAFRTGYKGGAAPTLLDGVNACVTGWMGGSALTEEDPRWTRLEAYLVSISDPAVTTPNPLAPEVLADETGYANAYGSGDAAAGASKYAQSCARCHDAGLRLGSVVAPAKAQLGLGVGRIAQQVRTSGPPPSGSSEPSDTTPGPMPFFEPSDLPAKDLADIIAFLRQ